MDTKTRNRQQSKSVASSAIAGTEGFNFELWASQVKQQMLTSLQRNKETIIPIEELPNHSQEDELE